MLYLVLHAEVQKHCSRNDSYCQCFTLCCMVLLQRYKALSVLYLVLHGPLAKVDRVVRVVRGPAIGGPVVPGLEPHVRNQVKVMSDVVLQCSLYKCQL